jgi:hypothetical protein
MNVNAAATLMLICLLALCGASAAARESPNRPAPPVDHPADANILLSLSGLGAAAQPTELSIKDLMAFPETTVTCVDPWTHDAHTFTGVSLAGLLESLQMRGGAKGIEIVAENGYTVGIALTDLKRHGYVLAYRMDGGLLRDQARARNRGALVIAFDLASHPDLNASVYRYQFAYQVRTIHVR